MKPYPFTIALHGLLGSFLCIIAVIPLHAEESAAGDAERLALAQEFSTTIKLANWLKPILLEEIANRTPETGKGQTEFETVRRKVAANVEVYLPQFQQDIIAMYASSCTTSELAALVQFYKTPSGTAFAARQLELETRSANIILQGALRALSEKQAPKPEAVPPAPDSTAGRSESTLGRELAAAITRPQLQRIMTAVGDDEHFKKQFPELIDKVGVLYAESFTPKELGDLIAFFKSPVGVKMLTDYDLLQKVFDAPSRMVTKMFNDADQK